MPARRSSYRPRRSRYRKKSSYKPRRYKKRSAWNDKMRKTKDVKLRLSQYSKPSLKRRVQVLEGNQSKHWDVLRNQSDHTGTVDKTQTIQWNGTTSAIDAPNHYGNSFIQLLAIQPCDTDGTRPRDSDKFPAREDNFRMGDDVFVTKVRLRGIMLGRVPKTVTTSAIGGVDVMVNTAAGPTVTAGRQNTSALMSVLCRTKIWLVVIQDKRPSVQDAFGRSEVNVPDAMNSDASPLESLAQYTSAQFGTSSTLNTQGYGAFLRSYENSRYAVKLAKAFVTTINSPIVEFDVEFHINKRLKYVPSLTTDGGIRTPTQPYNYNLYVYFLTQPPSMEGAANQFESAKILSTTQRLYFKDI